MKKTKPLSPSFKKSVKYHITWFTPEIEKIINARIVTCVILGDKVILGRYETNKTILKTILRDSIVSNLETEI